MSLFRLRCLLTALLVFLAGAASSASPTWDARKLVNEQGAVGATSLRADGKEVASVNRAHVAQFIEIVDRIGPQYGIRPEVVIVPGKSPNAFATKNKSGAPIVGVNPEMLALAGGDPDLAAVVVGHELAHLQLNHLEDGRNRQAVVGILAVIAGAAVGYNVARRGGDGAPFVELAGLGGLLVNRKFDRDQERNADELGMKAMNAAGYDVHAAPRLWIRMKQYGEGGSGLWTSTHPSHEERIEVLTQLASAIRPLDSTTPAAVARSSIPRASIERGQTVTQYSLSGDADWCLVLPEIADCTFSDERTCLAKGQCRTKSALSEQALNALGEPVKGTATWCLGSRDGLTQKCEFESWDGCNAARGDVQSPCTSREELRPSTTRPRIASTPPVSSAAPIALLPIACRLGDGTTETLPRVQCASRGGTPD